MESEAEKSIDNESQLKGSQATQQALASKLNEKVKICIIGKILQVFVKNSKY